MKERTTETQSTRRNESLRGFLRKFYIYTLISQTVMRNKGDGEELGTSK